MGRRRDGGRKSQSKEGTKANVEEKSRRQFISRREARNSFSPLKQSSLFDFYIALQCTYCSLRLNERNTRFNIAALEKSLVIPSPDVFNRYKKNKNPVE